MIMKNSKLAKLAGAGALSLSAAVASLSAGVAWADADISVQTSGASEATANVDISVVVPQVLIFGVGAVGDDIAQLQWTVDNAAGVGVGDNQSYSGAPAPFTSPAPLSNTATAAVVANGGTGASAAGNQADLPVFLFSNSGSDVTITTYVEGGATGGGTTDALDHQTTAATIPISDFTGGDGGVINQPTLSNTSSDTTAHTGGIVNLADTWTYSYTPSTAPSAGTYEARITYVAATP
jgi:hypothetical protein